MVSNMQGRRGPVGCVYPKNRRNWRFTEFLRFIRSFDFLSEDHFLVNCSLKVVYHLSGFSRGGGVCLLFPAVDLIEKAKRGRAKEEEEAEE